MKHSFFRLLALLLVFSCTACGSAAVPSKPDEQFPVSEIKYALERPAALAAALQSGRIRSILVVGDSISEGNSDDGCLWTQEERASDGGRLILTDETGQSYYENPVSSQGWVKYLRKEAVERCGVAVFHNAAIGGMSAKWFNAHKELLFSAEQPAYDAIFVMLGTNDRTACATTEEFRAEYSALLAYLKARCEYLTVLVPIPAIYDPTDSVKNLSSAEIAENVRLLCEENAYACIDCYRDFPQYAADEGLPLGLLYWGGTHPNSMGYAALWQSIAHAPAATAEPTDTERITCIGCNLGTPDGGTPIDAVQAGGTPVYPIGISWYYTWNPFTDQLPYGAFLETHRGEDGSAVQYARACKYQPTPFSYVRSWENGRWSAWAEN